MKHSRTGIVLSVALGFAWTASVPPAEAGCGCDKPPPPPAEVRPNVAYAGAPVSLISPSLSVGQQYTVIFSNGITGATSTIQGQAVSRRDLADGQFKSQLVIALPSMPLGPTNIVVTGPNGSSAEVLFVADSDFTVAPSPVTVSAQTGEFHFQNFQAAVGRNGVTYIALDVSSVTQPMIFEAGAAGFPLRFTGQDVVFYNIQGFLMQLLVSSDSRGRKAEPVPGMFVLPAQDTAMNSDVLHYSRHEFDTYFIQHFERQPHALDPSDPNWHLDGTPHVDHNHLILAINGRLNDGLPPSPGATAPCDLGVRTYSLFYQGLVGTDSVAMSGSAMTNSYVPGTQGFGSSGDVFTNGKVSLSNTAIINGDATATAFSLSATSQITGSKILLLTPSTFMQVKVPSLLPDLGTIDLSNTSMTINGPGSFQVLNLTVKSGGRLFIDNSAGPVTLYVLGQVAVSGGVIAVADPNPEKFAIYVASTKSVTLSGGATSFYGVVYAPTSTVSISGDGEFFGSFVGKAMKMSNLARVHYDQSLRGK